MVYASTHEEVEQVCAYLLRMAVPALGFDIEWRVTFKCVQLFFRGPFPASAPHSEANGERLHEDCATMQLVRQDGTMSIL